MTSKLTEQENNEVNININKKDDNIIHMEKANSIDEALSNLEASEDSLEGFTFPKEFLKLDLEKIREFIEILEEHYQSCLKKENISLAKSVKQRVILLKRLEKEKMKLEANIIYSNQRELVQEKMQEELNNYINSTNQEFESLLKTFENQEVEMLKNHQKEIDEFKKNFDKINENKKPKLSRECLNWIKIRDYAFKQNKFEKVNEANKEINKLMEKDTQKYKKEKEQKLNIEIKKINHRHDNEKKGFMLKKNSLIDMFNQTKDRNVEQIRKKYEAKLKELKNYQNFEMANFDKITKGITKPCARIQSIVSSTTGYKEEGDDEKGEIKGKEEEEDENDENNEEKENNDSENNKENEEEQDNNENDNGEEENNEVNMEEENNEENGQEENIEENGDEEENNEENGQVQENEEHGENINEEYEQE